MKKEIKIFDTTNYLSYDDYRQLCEDNDWDVAPENSQEYWDTVTREMEWDIENFWDNLRYSKSKDEKFFITGHLGLWNGTPDINPVVVTGLDKAISKCVRDSSIMDFDVELVNGELYVNAHHHDGTNSFTINKVSAHGLRGLDRFYIDNRGNISDDVEIRRDWVKRIELGDIC